MARVACRYGGGRYLGLDRRIGIRGRRRDGRLGAAYGAGLQEMGARIRLRSISEIVSPTGRRARRCSLPYTGEDFRKTDVWAALPIVKR